MLTPYYLRDPDNFVPANPLVTPVHIQPEWYFLFVCPRANDVQTAEQTAINICDNTLSGPDDTKGTLFFFFFLVGNEHKN